MKFRIDLESWLDDNTATLAAEPINRPRNVALAVRLLPLFDKFRKVGRHVHF